MHGLIIVQIQKFAQQTIGAQKWRAALEEAGLEGSSFSAGSVYDDSQALGLVVLAAQTLGAPVDEVVESFGRFLATELIRLYQRVIKPEWKTLEIIENTETFIHSAVRAGNPGAAPPVLDAIRISDNELHLLYSSDRKLCRLAIGIIKGLADHFQEIIEIYQDSCMNEGAAFCSFRLRRTSVRHDTENITIGNTIQIDLKRQEATSEYKTPMELGVDFNISESSTTEPTRWERYLSPRMFESDFASIGPYRLLARQGEGGMGCVFRSIDTRTEQSVAIKILHPEVAKNRTAQTRFLREFKALKLIKSNHVVEVRDVGQIGQIPYLVMEFLKGTNLRDYCLRFQGVPNHEIIRIAIETVKGLSAVHDVGIIHRDLKPENLWVENPSLNVKIIDFGLAHAVAEDSRVTRTGTFNGTPSFIAPEQASGREVDHRADFFSLGCVFYELATGTRPFDKGNLMATLSALANDTPAPPIEVVSDLPSELSDLIMKMIEKVPANRPQSCAEIQAVLNNI
ncbi:MAG: hypothetical protein RLY14_358 [Planctomycetota bacterium]|jgi:predicted hydrocarbon binding protein